VGVVAGGLHPHGGSVDGDNIILKAEQPMPVQFEKSFENLFPVATMPVQGNDKKDVLSFNYTGTGFVLRGGTAEWGSNTDFVLHTELYVDGKLVEKPELPASYTTRRYEVCWDYDLPKGKHEVQLKILNASDRYKVSDAEAIYYSDTPIDGMKENEAEAAKEK